MNSTTSILKGQKSFERHNHMAQIIIKYFFGQLNEQEKEELNQWLACDVSNQLWLDEIRKNDWLDNTIGDFRPMPLKDSFKKTMSRIKRKC